MKKSKIIIPALAMLVMSTAATVTGTVAWFSVNKTVTARGMTVAAKGDSSLVIKGQSTYGSTDPSFTSVGVNSVTAANMKPCTSYDGKNFAKLGEEVTVEDAGAATATWTGASGALGDGDLVTITDSMNKPADDYIYYAQSGYDMKSLAEAKNVYVKSIDIETTAAAKLIDSVRVSVTCGSTTLVFNPRQGSAATVGKLSGSTWSLAAPSYTTVNTAAAKIGGFAADTVYAVLINIWFEGQDSDCFSDNVDGGAITVVAKFTTDQTALVG